MGAGPRQVARHRVLVDIDQAAGGTRPASLPEVFQDGESFLVGQAGVLKVGPLALGGAAFSGTAVDQTYPSALAVPAAEIESSAASDAGVGAIGILTAEVLDGDHVVHPCS
jgi:hypothetical protein